MCLYIQYIYMTFQNFNIIFDDNSNVCPIPYRWIDICCRNEHDPDR